MDFVILYFSYYLMYNVRLLWSSLLQVGFRSSSLRRSFSLEVAAFAVARRYKGQCILLLPRLNDGIGSTGVSICRYTA